MLAKRVIPCLDVKDGRVVKGVNFVDLIDAGDPVAQAQVYDREGADELVFLDITATHEARAIVIDMVRRVADTVFIPFTVGGGIRTVDDMRAILLAGAVTAFVPASFTLSVVAGALYLLETDIVTITTVKGGAGKVITGTFSRYQGDVSSAAEPACASMDEHSKIELDTVQKVILISCGVIDVFMEVYLAGACSISMWRLSYPERGATEWSEANRGRSISRESEGLPRLGFRG